ncbi:MAG: hypothetical protein LBF88_03990 [Planctomycetaceae bacterium]|nr:hypothetical protein [Planctomycetaceae bacterium]
MRIEICVVCRLAVRFPAEHRGKVGYRRPDVSGETSPTRKPMHKTANILNRYSADETVQKSTRERTK